jgi:glyoxylase-like metal-dependent hydrolase (beta-lactamase superfamily II)
MPSIGSYELHTIDCGRFKLDGGGMFGIVPKPLWERHTSVDDRNRIPLAMRCLLLAGDERVILIDTGIGETFSEKFADIYAVDYSETDLHTALTAAGFTAEDVTDVILTHLHFDHCGGCTRGTGDDAEIVFSNATFYVQQRHWEWATNSKARDRASFLEQNLAPLKASGQLELLDGPGELFPGVELLVVDGHTRGQHLVKVSDETSTLVFVADLIPTTAHFPELWNMAYDIAPLDTVNEKMGFLKDACTNDWQLFFEHDPDTCVTSVTETSKGYGPAHERSLEHLFRHA